VSPPQTVATTCTSQLTAITGTHTAAHTSCTGTELALYEHDLGVPTAAAVASGGGKSCLQCAVTSGCADSAGTGASVIRECDDNATSTAALPSTGATANTFYASTTVAECNAEVACGVGVINDPNCNASTLSTAAATACKTSSGTYQLGANGNAVSNLYCSSDDAPTCAAVSAPAAPGSCVNTWLAGLPTADQQTTATGGTAQADGAKKGYASGFANGILTCLFNNCEANCLIQ
jgi:hypothetical protein